MVDSTTEERFATIPAGDADDIDRAVAAAKAAFAGWSERTGAERGKLLQRVADTLEARRDEIAAVIAHEVGMPKHQALDRTGGWRHLRVRRRRGTRHDLSSSKAPGSRRRARRAGAGRRRRVHHAVELPAEPDRREGRVPLAAGCTVVLKPSEVAPVNAFILAEIIDEIGFPPACSTS